VDLPSGICGTSVSDPQILEVRVGFGKGQQGRESPGRGKIGGAWIVLFTGTNHALQSAYMHLRNFDPGGTIRKFIVSLLGAATLTAGLFIVRQQQQKVAEAEAQKHVPAGGKVARDVSIQRLRELGL
jgi:hypothetical protein